MPMKSDARRFYRHATVVRATHWINALCLVFLLMSGLNIFNARPDLYLGSRSSFHHPVLSIGADDSGANPKGVTTILGHKFTTTGVLGVSGEGDERAFPAWSTIPSDYDLATARRWHFLFAWIFVLNGLLYLTFSVTSGHLRRDLVPKRAEFAKIGPTFLDHLRLHFPHGEEAKRYNVMQMISYLIVGFVLLPIMVLAGWSMSPGVDSLAHFLPQLFGGRQSARTIHFAIAWLLVLFTIVHLLMVLISGVWNNVRSMITGRYDLGEERPS